MRKKKSKVFVRTITRSHPENIAIPLYTHNAKRHEFLIDKIEIEKLIQKGVIPHFPIVFP